MAYLIVAEQGKLKKYEITEDFLFIGRTPENQIRISDPHASRQHCQIIKVDGGYRLIDLESQHGTLVKGQKVKQKDLVEGDIFQIGAVKIAIKEIGQAAAPDSAAPPARPPARRRTAARGPARQAEPEKITIRKDMAAASARGGHLVRRNLRKGSKIPGWAQAVIAFWVVVIVGFIVYRVVISSSSPYDDTFERAVELWQTEHKYDEAFTLFETIPHDDPEFGEKSRKFMKDIQRERTAGNVQQSSIGSQRWFDNNIELFIWKYIEAPADKPSWARKIKRDYVHDRPSFVRILLKNRIIPFMEKFPNDKRMPQVKELYNKYSKEVNIDLPASFRDVELECDCALNLSGYGVAYQNMSQWMADNPDTELRERVDWTFKTIWNRLQQEWTVQNREITKNEADGKPKYALKKIDRMLKLTDGLDSPEGRKFRADLKRRRAENQAKVDALTGGASRSNLCGT